MTGDILPRTKAAEVGDGWYLTEFYGGEMFRWVNNDAMLYVTTMRPCDYRVTIVLEPGPGVESEPLVVTVLDERAEILVRAEVTARRSLEVNLPASAPTVHWLRLHCEGGGRKTTGDERILNFRVFSIAVEPVQADVLPTLGGFEIGDGWFPLEHHNGATFRWVENDARFRILPDHDDELALDVEVGPGAGNGPLHLTVLAEDGTELHSADMGHRSRLTIRVPESLPTPCDVRLHVEGGGQIIADDPRVLNFRVFESRARWMK